jgi:hypothetical protein
MRKLILSSSCLLVAGVAAAPAVAKSNQLASASSQASCDAKYYNYLVGKDVSETREINVDDYRTLPAGVAVGESKPRRLTFFYDKKSNRIVDVACG